MNTYFFVRVRLGRAQGRRSFSWGPYVEYEDALRVLDAVPDLLLGLDADPSRYTATVEERSLQTSKWVRVNRRLHVKVEKDQVTTESACPT